MFSQPTHFSLFPFLRVCMPISALEVQLLDHAQVFTWQMMIHLDGSGFNCNPNVKYCWINWHSPGPGIRHNLHMGLPSQFRWRELWIKWDSNADIHAWLIPKFCLNTIWIMLELMWTSNIFKMVIWHESNGFYLILNQWGINGPQLSNDQWYHAFRRTGIIICKYKLSSCPRHGQEKSVSRMGWLLGTSRSFASFASLK